MRHYTAFATPADRTSLALLADEHTPPAAYQAELRKLGASLADEMLLRLGPALPERLCVAVTVEDADSLGAGIIGRLEEKGLGDRVRVVCFWNGRIELEGLSLAPILKEYREPCNIASAALIVVKSIIASACVVRTNLANLIAQAAPSRIFVLAPVMFKGADEVLRGDFAPEIANRFEYVTLAIDDEKRDGKWVEPGVGGDIYIRLGYGGATSKNQHVPELIKRRRRQPALSA